MLALALSVAVPPTGRAGAAPSTPEGARRDPARGAVKGRVVAFPFEDERWLAPGQTHGGSAWVAEGAKGAVPLVVVLHGVNDQRRLHPLLDGEDDVRPTVDALVASGSVTPLVVAAPTHAQNAAFAEVVLPGFDLDAFVDATSAALAPTDARVDRARVVVVGHSGGACNPTGGLLAVAKRRGAVVPLALVESDGCVDSYVADALKQAPGETRVMAFWQTWMWPRRFDTFRQLMAARPSVVLEEVRVPRDVTAHDRALDAALARALPQLLPR